MAIPEHAVMCIVRSKLFLSNATDFHHTEQIFIAYDYTRSTHRSKCTHKVSHIFREFTVMKDFHCVPDGIEDLLM
jgi:hypothetical protein